MLKLIHNKCFIFDVCYKLWVIFRLLKIAYSEEMDDSENEHK